MSDAEARNTDLPEDDHLRNDVQPGSGAGTEQREDKKFTPGQTNAGQQVGGLASATGYADDQDPDEADSNNPV